MVGGGCKSLSGQGLNGQASERVGGQGPWLPLASPCFPEWARACLSPPLTSLRGEGLSRQASEQARAEGIQFTKQ